MRVLYVAYSFPPVNIVAAQRAMFQARYMAEAGAEVTVICAEQTRKRDDPSLLEYLKNVPRLTIHRISPWGSRYELKSSTEGFKPSAKGWFWVLRAFLLVRKLLQQQSFDLVYTTFGPKYPHLVGRLIHERCKLPWVAEYRDPWHGSNHKAGEESAKPVGFERWLMRPASLLVTVSGGFQQTLQRVHGSNRAYAVVYNGFDPEAYGSAVGTTTSARKEADALRLILAGTVYPFQQESLRLLLQAIKGRNDVVFEYYGSSAPLVQRLVNDAGAESICRVSGQVTHALIVERLLQADAAVLPVSPAFVGQLPVKFYDYLAARKPVLMLKGAGTEIETLLLQTNSGANAETTEEVMTWLHAMQSGQVDYSFEGAEFFTRKNQAERLLQYLKDTLK